MWDSALVIKDILKGHALLNNWLGWYFPLIWEGLYRLTGVVHIMGSYILLLYWIGITICPTLFTTPTLLSLVTSKFSSTLFNDVI